MDLRPIRSLLLITLVGHMACQQPSRSSNMETRPTNRLAQESSPYLQQHKHNPVDWYPWGEEAFEKARSEDKLVLVSVGYSACHWCHVMEHETFEDDEAAAYMNDHFVCIKVDREERPDIDQIYMTAVQLMTQRGGWPLNCFTLPDGKPIYGGTYFNKKQWMDVLKLLVGLKSNEPEKIRSYAEELTEAIRLHERIEAETGDSPLPRDLSASLIDRWKPRWDLQEGGVSSAPKFPLPNNYSYLFHFGALTQDSDILDFAHLSVTKILRGGIYDQIGGGLARYSTDDLWKVPHFEKMLYDNGQFLGLLATAQHHRPNAEYVRAMRSIVAWLDREMTDEQGLFYSALDADSEGEEGKFYVWKEDAFRAIAGTDAKWAIPYFNVDRDGFWEKGNYILLRTESDVSIANRAEISLEELHANVDDLSRRLLDARSSRTRPGLDDKILVSWNALMITGLAQAASACQEKGWIRKATTAAEKIWGSYKDRGYLEHSRGSGHIGFLEDYALFAESCLALYRATMDESWIEKAGVILEDAWKEFGDEESGMCWYTAHSSENLIARKQENHDNVIPASGSVMAQASFEFGHLTGNQVWLDRSARMLRNMLSEMTFAQNVSNWGMLLEKNVRPYYHLCITGSGALEAAEAIRSMHLPNVLLSAAESASDLEIMHGKLQPQLTFYVCVDKACKRPVHTLEEALEQLKW